MGDIVRGSAYRFVVAMQGYLTTSEPAHDADMMPRLLGEEQLAIWIPGQTEGPAGPGRDGDLQELTLDCHPADLVGAGFREPEIAIRSGNDLLGPRPGRQREFHED